jgi:ATP-dependent helicase HrpA
VNRLDNTLFYQLLDHVWLKDQPRLKREWFALEKHRNRAQHAASAPSPLDLDTQAAQLEAALNDSIARVDQRRQGAPRCSFAEQLPISQAQDSLKTLIAEHQVIVIAGETGSGKTTQLPKLCLQMGLGTRGLIGHTQPRRLAARSVATRIAEELGCPLGAQVGFQIRFTDDTGPDTYIKVMTDGILLAEIQRDPLLLTYDALIIDEAHERSLNIDFLLGYLKQLAPKRPDLKILITSATIDLERFSAHFNGAPILDVPGRNFPVTLEYRPPEFDGNDPLEAIMHTVEDILSLPKGPSGDILIFLPGEREIRDTAKALRQANFDQLDILPLYSRLSASEQHRVFSTHKNRRVVLATNVAETSITVPGIGYVIDPGTARISRYSSRSRLQRLVIEPISQASANQRAGRCGRVSAGICYRLYSQDDFLNRPAFTDPEILRTSLTAVVLQLLHLNVRDITQFPFLEMPDTRAIKDAFKTLEQLQAIGPQQRITAIGRTLLALPVDPRLGRMLIAAADRGCLPGMLIIVAALSIQDPRERPPEKQQAADEKHRRFAQDDSDFMAWPALWDYVETQRQELSASQWKKQCEKDFLSANRLREWRELHHQLLTACKHVKLWNERSNRSPQDPEQLHKALLTGIFDTIAQRLEDNREREYAVAGQRKASIFPSSSQFKKMPKWVLAASILETSKVFLHTVAKIEPEWIIECLPHLLKHHYYEPHYALKAGQVMAYDRVTFLGLIVADKKRVIYNTINPDIARSVFIREALVEGRYGEHRQPGLGAFFTYNKALLDDVEDLEAKARRRDIRVDDEDIYAFYDARIPPGISSLIAFEQWRKSAEASQPDLLKIPRDLIMQHSASHISEAAFPNCLSLQGVIYPLRYEFEPGQASDGVNLSVQASQLHSLPAEPLEWLVPGLIREKCIALLKGLPKQWRKHCVPVPECVDQALARIAYRQGALTAALRQAIKTLRNIDIPEEAWAAIDIEPFFVMNLRVVDDKGHLLSQGRDLPSLRNSYRDTLQATLQQAGSDLEKTGITHWNFGHWQHECYLPQGRIRVQAFPALVDEKTHVSIKLKDNALAAQCESRKGLARLALLAMPQTVKYLKKTCLKNQDLRLSVLPLGNRDDVIDDLLLCAVQAVCFTDEKGQPTPMPPHAEAFDSAVQRGETAITAWVQTHEALLITGLTLCVQIQKALKNSAHALALAMAAKDIHEQVTELIYPGFLFQTPPFWLNHLERYLKAILQRIEKAAQNPHKDSLATREVAAARLPHQAALAQFGLARFSTCPEWIEYRYMIEELRVSLFAQQLKTLAPVSSKRLQGLWSQVEAALGQRSHP